MDERSTTSPRGHLIITVHGIRTFGNWQERLEALLNQEAGAAGSQVEVYNYKYGYFSALAFLIPPIRWLVTLRFRKAMLACVKEQERDRIDIVAHSFGTHLSAWGLYGIKPSDRPQIHTFVLCASVLKPGFPWRDLLGRSVGRVINECGTRDSVLILNQFVVLFTGMAGRVGFSGMTGRRFRNRFFAFGHGGYFRTGGRDDDSFMRLHWLPLLCRDEDITVIPDSRPSGPLAGILAYAINNAEPMKLSAYALAFGLAFLWIYGLYRDAEEERRNAERQTRIAVARGLAAEARLVVEDDPWLATLLSAEAIATTKRMAERRVPEADGALRSALSRISGVGIADFGGRVIALEIDQTGRQIVAAGFDQSGRCKPVHVWFSGEGLVSPTLLPGTADCSSASLSADGSRLLTLGRRHRPALWKLSSQLRSVERTALPTYSGEVRLAELSRDGQWLALVEAPADTSDLPSRAKQPQWKTVTENASALHALHLFELKAETAIARSIIGPLNPESVTSIVFSHDGSYLAAAGRFDTKRGTDQNSEFSPSQRHPEVAIWRLAENIKESRPTRLKTGCDAVYGLDFDESGSSVIAACNDGMRVWKYGQNGQDWTLAFQSSGGGRVTRISPDGNWLVMTAPGVPSYALAEPTARVWHLGSGNETSRSFNVGIASSEAFFSPDSRWLALARLDRVVMWRLEDLLENGDLASGQQLTGALETAIFTPASDTLVTGSEDNRLLVWSLSAGTWRPSIGLGGDERASELLKINGSGDVLVSADRQGNIRVRRIDERQPAVDPAILWGATEPNYIDGGYRPYNLPSLDSGSLDRVTSASWTGFQYSQAQTNGETRLAVPSPGGRWIITAPSPIGTAAGAAPGIYLNDLRERSSKGAATLVCHGYVQSTQWDIKRSVTFGPDEDLAVVRCDRGDPAKRNGVFIFDCSNGCMKGTRKEAAEWLAVETLAFSPDGRWLAAGGTDTDTSSRRVYLWDRTKEEWRRKPVDVTPRVEDHEYPWRILFSPLSGWLVVGGEAGIHRLVDLNRMEVGRSYQDWPSSERAVLQVAFSPDDHWLVAVGASGAGSHGARAGRSDDSANSTHLIARIWELEHSESVGGGKPVHVVSGSTTSSMDLEFSSSGRWLVTASPSRLGAARVGAGAFVVEAKLWQLQPGSPAQLVHDFRIPASTPFGEPGWVFRFSRNERWLVMGRKGGETALLKKLEQDGAEFSLALARGRNRPGLEEFEFSPDGTMMAVLGDGISLWFLKPPAKPESTFLPHEFVGQIDADLAKEWSSVAGVQLFGNQLAFTSDGRRLVAFGKRLAAVWTTSTDELTAKGKGAVGRNMRWGEWDRFVGSDTYRKTFAGLPVDQSVIQSLVGRARRKAGLGAVEEGRDAFRTLAQWSVELQDGASCNSVGWAGALAGYAAEVIAAGDCAVQYEPDSASHWDTRGLIRSLTGDRLGALADFEMFVRLSEGEGVNGDLATRRGWIAALKAGHKPITPTVLARLRAE